MIFMMVTHVTSSQNDRNGFVGLVELKDCTLFANISKGCSTADNEKYYPTLFTIKFPLAVNNFWYSVQRESEYIFDCKDGQLIYIFDVTSRHKDEYGYCYKNDSIYEIDKARADSLLLRMQSYLYDRDAIMSYIQEDVSASQCTGSYYVSISCNLFFVFYGITDIMPDEIIKSIHIVRPHEIEFSH